MPSTSNTTCATTARRLAALASYAQILRHWEHASRSYFNVETYSFKGPDVYDGTKPRDLNVENEADSKFSRDHHQRLARLAPASFRVGDRAAARIKPTSIA